MYLALEASPIKLRQCICNVNSSIMAILPRAVDCPHECVRVLVLVKMYTRSLTRSE